MTLMESLQAAATADEVLQALARATWAKTHDGAELPDGAAPSGGSLGAFMSENARAPDGAVEWWEEADDLLRRCAEYAEAPRRAPAEWPYVWGWVVPEPDEENQRLTAHGWRPRRGGTGFRLVVQAGIEEVHVWWLRAKATGEGVRHPLAPLVAAWLERPVPAEWDERQWRNLPGPLANTRHVVPAGTAQADGTHLPFDLDSIAPTGPPSDAPRFEVGGYLPTLAPEPSTLVPSALLALWDTGASRGRSGPVPVPRRTGLEVLIAVPPETRGNDAVLLTTTLGQLFNAVWPGTRYYRAENHGRQLLSALRDVGDPAYGAVAWRADAHAPLRVLVLVRSWPQSLDADAEVEFDVRLPPGSRQGPQVDAVALRGVSYSYRQHRLLLTAYCLMDRYATVRGRLIDPTRPVVRRDAAGYVLDAHGKVVTERGEPTRRATHPKAVQTGERERNPEADRRYPVLRGRDLILSGYNYVAETADARRDQRRNVLDAARTLAKAVEIEPKRGAADRRRPARLRVRIVDEGTPEAGLQMLPVEDYLSAYRSRWAARRYDRS